MTGADEGWRTFREIQRTLRALVAYWYMAAETGPNEPPGQAAWVADFAHGCTDACRRLTEVAAHAGPWEGDVNELRAMLAAAGAAARLWTSEGGRGDDPLVRECFAAAYVIINQARRRWIETDAIGQRWAREALNPAA